MLLSLSVLMPTLLVAQGLGLPGLSSLEPGRCAAGCVWSSPLGADLPLFLYARHVI